MSRAVRIAELHLLVAHLKWKQVVYIFHIFKNCCPKTVQRLYCDQNINLRSYFEQKNIIEKLNLLEKSEDSPWITICEKYAKFQKRIHELLRDGA